MIKNYFKIAWRNLWKHKVFSIVNICGLAIGLSAFWLITLYITNELSYDRYHKHADKIFRVVSHAKWDGGSFDITGTSAPFAPALKSFFPEIQETVRIAPEGGGILNYGEKHFQEDAICFADKTLFNIFSYHFLYGNAATALAKPQSIVLTKTLASKLFGDPAKALSQTVTFENNYPNRVTGVIEDLPANSHFTFKAVRSLPENFTEGWGMLQLYTYVKLAQNTDIRSVESRLPLFVKKLVKPRFVAEGMNVNFNIELQPLTSIHLHSNLVGELGQNGNMSYIYIFSIVGILILIMASINYMNLSTARASVRIKEIAVRKVTGSSKNQLMILFLADAVLLTLIATSIALIVIYFALPWYNEFINREIDLWYFGIGKTLTVLLSFTVLTGIVIGLYPALFLSRFRLIPSLKGQSGSQTENAVFRKSLVAFQYVITICMISGFLIMYQQMHYVQKKDLGFNKDEVLTFHLAGDAVRARIPALKAQLLQNPIIESIGSAGIPIGKNIESQTFFNDINGDKKVTHYLPIDEDFLPALQIRLTQGRNYSKKLPTDKTQSLVVNESLVKEAGWKNPLGKKINVDDDTYTIIGVVKDFNFLSLQHKIEPLVMPLPLNSGDADNLYIRVSKENIPEALKYIEQSFRKFDNSSPLTYSFLDESFAEQYEAEQKQGNLLLMFTILAILIACLGLFGLVTFMIEQRIKEIGIRKVLGASVNSIVALVSKDFIKLVLIAALIAFPIAWWAMNKWLQDFAYRIEIEWWTFVLAGAMAILIALATVSFQAIKAAIANPVKSLRTE